MRKTVKSTSKEAFQKTAEHKRIQKETEQKLKQEHLLLQYLAVIVAAFGFIIYVNTLSHGYALDDYSLILENASTKKGISGLGEIFRTSYRYGYIFATDEIYRPLSKAMFAIEWSIAPNSPTIGHWVNVILYSITGFFLTVTLYKYFRSPGIAFIAALLFIVHPIHTEVVANIKSRDEILAFLFSVLSLLTMKKYADEKKSKYAILTAVFFFLALLSKESAITMIGIFALVWFFYGKGKSNDFIKPIIGVVVSTLIFFLIRSSIVGNIVTVKPSVADNLLMAAPDLMHRLATAFYIAGLYIKLLIFPDQLAFDYSFNQIPVIGLNDWRFIISFLVIAAAAIMALVKIKSRSIWAFGILFFFITFSISSNILIMIGTSMAERLMYTPSLGFCLLAAYFINKLSKANSVVVSIKDFILMNPLRNVITVIIVLLFSLRTIARNPVWENNYNLYVNDVKVSPNSTRTHYYLGNLMNKEDFLIGKTEKEKDSIANAAIAELKKSIAIYPPFTDAWNQLGVLYNKQKNYKEAMNCYETALKYNPNEPTVQNNIGAVFFATANFPAAVKAFDKAISINPNYFDAYSNLGGAYGEMKKYPEAVNAFQQAIRIDPGNAMAHHYLGITYQFMGNQSMANMCFEKEKELTGQ